MSSVATLTELTPAQRRALLKMARARDLVGDRSELPPIEPASREGRLPLSFAQQRLWFVEQLGSLGATYHMHRPLRLRGALDRAALVRALDGVVARHEALRTTFAQADGVPEQRIAPAEASRFHLVEHDLADAADADAELDRITAEEAHAPFDLERGPLIRGRLVRLAADDHVLLLTMHHVVSDGWSLGVLTRELSALYAAHHEGREADLPALPVQYADYAAWQRRWVSGEALREQADYWKNTLAGAPELLELPTDRPRPAQMDHAGASLRVELDEELTAGLKALSQRHGTTLFMTVLAGWATVLSRLSGQEDVVVGTPVANRGRREIEGLIGFFVNTLALRVDLSGAPTVAQVLAQVKTRALQAQQNQDIPFDQVVELVQPARSLAHTPLFQVMFAWRNAPTGALALPGLTLAPAGAASHVTAKFDLMLSIGEAGGRIAGEVEYATSLFETETVERWIGYLRRVLMAMVANDALAADRLPMLPQAERRRVLREFNDTRREYPRDTCVHELFEAQAARTPGAVAVVSEAERVTYAELNARANRLAHHLRALGVAPDARVGICVERSVEMVVGLLGILKAGGAYVPLDSSYPVDRLRCMLEDSAPAVLLTHPPLAATVAELAAGSAVPVLDLTDHAAWAHRSAGNPGRDGLGPQNLVHVLFTSGSTGRPKGVMLEHGSLVNRLTWMHDQYAMEPHEALLQKTPFSFDVSFWEFFWPLMVGARLVMARPGGHRDPAYLVEVIRRERITVAHFVPSMLQVFLEHPDAGLCTGLLRVPVSGEAVSAALARQFHERLPGVGLYNQYGPTESGEVTEWACPPGLSRVSIGRAIHNSAVYVLDRAGEPAPVGAAGELFIGGVAVARGYLGRPRLTAERFVPDPFGEPGARMYRTGDLCRWLPDGTLEYLGRTDFQVKVRGFRVELGEIEAQLAAHPGVREVVVLALDNGAGGKRLAAWYVGEALESEALRAHLAAALPEYMVPAAFVRMEAFPVTPNGKLDRRALPAPADDAFARRGHEAPVGETEEALAGIWSGVLGMERVGRRDNFFELGGHSLLAVQVISRVRQVLRVEVALGELFARPVLTDFARALETAARAELPPIGRADREGRLPLSLAQQRLWFLERLGGLGSTYHFPMRRRLRGPLHVDALERALGEIVRRHETLRTTFTEADGAPVQVAAPFGGFTLPVEDLSGLGEAEREAAVRRRAGEEARRPFDLSAGPLFRAALLRLGAEEHVLLLSMHHIVSDGWSMEVLFRELSALYAAYREGGESPLPELAVQYADFAVWQREQVEGAVLDRQLAYWRERLAGAPELLELPTDHPRPAVQAYRGETVPVELSPELLRRLEALGRGEGATLYMTLLGAFQVLLSKYSGSDDVVVGSPIAGRTRKEVEDLIGFFVNTLVLRTDLSGDPSFREVLRRAREVTLGAYAHQEVPFERLVAELRPERSMSHTPLFQVMFTLQNAGGGEAALPGLRVSGVEAERPSAKFDLSLALTATPQGLRGGLTYSTDLFERATVDRMLGHLERVLEQVAADADVRLSRLALLGDAECAGVLALGEGAAPAFPRATVDALFAQAAAAAPEAVALAWDGGRMTYAELDARANRLARHLRRLGVGAGTRVGLCLERGPRMVVATLAALKAGGAYVPLDPAYPAERLAFMLADTAVPVLVTESALADRLPPHAARVVRVDADAAAIAAEPADAPAAGTDPEAAAYVMYTSGSTGRPKGVEVPHRAIVRLVRGQDYVAIDPSDVFLQLAPASFDAATLELWGPLLNGARLALHPAGPPSVESIGRALAEHGVTVLWLTAGLFHLVVEERIGILRGVRQLLAGGDVLSVPHVRRVLAELPETALINGYGPTENTTFTCCHRIGEAPREGASIPVGRPIANTCVRVLDAALQPAPVGVPGELYAGGAGLALGYLDRPELTAEKFVPDPFAPGARLYRTGDRVRWRADGTVEFLGRVDTQVKIRGFRVEPGEVEAVLRAWPGVREAAVVVREDTAGDRRLVAYVAGEVAADALREHLRGRLPEHMLPGALVCLDGLPLTANGKLDRKALPAPEFAPAEERYVAPRTPVEEVLAEIWAEVLRLERVGVEESFFDLGGHSLLATRVVSRVREVFGVELPLRALFEGPTVAGMAGRVEDERRRELPVLPPVAPAGRTGALPLSFAQERLWFVDRLKPGSAVYNVPMAWRLGGALDVGALERALGEIVRRHEALRTVFAAADGSPVQVIAPFGGFALPVEELSGLDEAEREAAVGRRAVEEARRAFDLSAGPLFRAVLLRVGAEDHVLLLAMHHIVSDGWSMGVLHRELSALYEAYRDGRESPLPELAVQYADYALWQREQVEGEVLDRQLAYWRERLAGAPELLELPADRPRPLVQTYRGATVPVEFPLELLERLQALGRGEGATLYMTLLGAFQVLLSKYSGSRDVVVGSPIAGRTRTEVEDLIGFFVNTLVLRTDLGGDPTFREVLRRAREVTLGAYEHQEVPFERLVAELSPERSLSHSPLFQVIFALQNAGGGDGGLPGLTVRPVEAGLGSAKFDLSLALTATPQGLRGGLNYSTDLFERATVERMLADLGRVLEQVAADADVRLSRIGLLGEAERALLLDEWNRTERPYPREVCIHELFEAQVRARPQAVALAWDGVELTYQELAARANRLAHHLVRRGVGPEARVGVLLERSAELIVSLLAVLKAGGCYVPLDPGYPAERLRLMLDDSGVRVVVSRGELAGVVGTDGLDVVHLDRDAGAIASEPAEAPRGGATAGNLAYIVYTSGSTGRPKGVMIGHRQVVQLVVGTDYVQLHPGDRVAQASNAGFDALTFELWGALLNGATLVGIPQDVLLSPPALRETLRGERVTTLFLTTALVNQLSHEEPDIFAPLREVLFGGQAADADCVRRLLKAGRPRRLLNMYGPTEATTFCLYEQVEDVPDGALAIPLGHATANQRVYLLDGALNPVPRGVRGEAYVSGGGVARGYLDRPGLTAERFVPDPFSGEPGARMYRTGDRMRWRGERKLDFVGRVDDQVKIRGFRIEPGEVENALSAHPAVREARVVVREDQPGDKRLVAYVVGGVEPEAVRAYLRESLPEYMVPAAIVGLERLPVTPNGKVDTRALPAPESGPAKERQLVPPRTEAERRVAAVWAEVLGVEAVGAHDGFFDLGGHSLLLVKVQGRLREAFGVPVPITHLFRYLTVSALAAALETPAPEPSAAPADEARVRDGRQRLRARARAGTAG